MASRGCIAIQDDEGWITKAFLHHEAYPYTSWPPFRGAGEILLEQYRDPAKIRRLIHHRLPPDEPPQPLPNGEYAGYDIDYLEDDLDLCQYADDYPPVTREVQELDELLEDVADDPLTEHLYIFLNEGWWIYQGPDEEVQELDELLEDVADDPLTEHLYIFLNEGWWIYQGPDEADSLQTLASVIGEQAARDPKKQAPPPMPDGGPATPRTHHAGAPHPLNPAAGHGEDTLTTTTDNRGRFQWKFLNNYLRLQRRHNPDSERIDACIYYNDAYSAQIRMTTGFTSLNRLKAWQQPDGWTQNNVSNLSREGQFYLIKLLTKANIPTLDEAVRETETIIQELETRFMTAGEHLDRMREFADTTSRHEENGQ